MLHGCHAAFADLVDRSFGNITADQCYRDGDETACRINSLVTAFRGTPVIWIHELSDDSAIDAAVSDLRSRYLKVPAVPCDTKGSMRRSENFSYPMRTL